MARRRAAKKEVVPDPRYQSKTVAKFINHIMKRGKKSVARTIVYRAFDIIKEQTKQDPSQVFNQALSNIKPKMEVRSRRVGGANYQVPYRVPEERGFTLAMRWIIKAARSRSGSPMEKRLAHEILEAKDNQGSAVRKKINTHRMAQANKAFAYLGR